MDLFSLLFFVVGIPVTIVTAIYAHATYLYARGDLAQQKGRYDDAIMRFEKAARGINPFGRGVALTALGRVYLKDGRPDEGVPILREAAGRTKHPSAVLAIYQLFSDSALHENFSGNRVQLLEEAEDLLGATRMPQTLKAIALGQIAGAYHRLGEVTKALKTAEAALGKDDLNPTALFLSGWLYLGTGDIEKAKKRFTALLNVTQKDQKPLGKYGLGVAYFYEGEFAKAAEQFQRAAHEGNALLQPFAFSRAAIARVRSGDDPSKDLEKAEARTDDLAKRQIIAADSGAHWLISMAQAYAAKDQRLADSAIEQAPAWDRSEAKALAKSITGAPPAAGWLGEAA